MKTFSKKEALALIERAKENREKIEKQYITQQNHAIEAFKDHEVRVITNTPEIQAFECRNKNGSWCYGFKVICADNFISMYGDLDTLTFLPGYNRDGLRWMRGSINSRSYFFEKLDSAHREKVKHYDIQYAIDAVLSHIYYDDMDEVVEYNQQELNLLYDCFEENVEREHEFYEKAYYDYNMDEAPIPTCSRSTLEYRYQALKKFCELLDEIEFSIQKKDAV